MNLNRKEVKVCYITKVNEDNFFNQEKTTFVIQKILWQRVKYDKLIDNKIKQKKILKVHENLISLICWNVDGGIKE